MGVGIDKDSLEKTAAPIKDQIESLKRRYGKAVTNPHKPISELKSLERVVYRWHQSNGIPTDLLKESREYEDILNCASPNERRTLIHRELNNLRAVVETTCSDYASGLRSETTVKLLQVPQKVTLLWLYKHISWKQWAFLASLLAASFVAGANFGNTDFGQQLLGLEDSESPASTKQQMNAESSPETSETSGEKSE